MKPHIDEVRRQLVRRLEAVEFVQAESGIVPAQCSVHGGIMPAGIAEFEGITVGPRQRFEKGAETREVARPPWRQLKKNRPELVTEYLHGLQKAGNGGLRIVQFFAMRNVAASFDCKTE